MALMDARKVLVEPAWTFLLTRRFDISDAERNVIGSITGGSIDLEIRDAEGRALGYIERPWKLLRVRVQVADAERRRVGSIVQVTPWGRIRFEVFDERGSGDGAIAPTQAWAMAFDLTDASGARRARIGRRYRFWRTGSYSVEFEDGADDRTRLLALAGIVAIDKAVDGRRSSSAAPVA